MTKIDKLKRAVIKEELVAVVEYGLEEEGISTRDSYKLAILLNQSLYWAERVGQERYQKFLVEESTREAEKVEGLEGGWIYKKAQEWADDCLLGVSDQTVRRWFDKLIKIGYILERDNPKVKFDHTKQYRLNLLKIIKNLHKLGYRLDGYKTASLLNLHNGDSENQSGDSKDQNGDRDIHNGGTIPEITTEITTESTTESTVNKEEEEARVRILRIYEKVFSRTISPYQLELIDSYLNDGFDEATIVLAIKEAGLNNADGFSYIKAILDDWLSKGLTSYDKANNYLKDRKLKMSNKSNRSNSGDLPKNVQNALNLVEQCQDEGKSIWEVD